MFWSILAIFKPAFNVLDGRSLHENTARSYTYELVRASCGSYLEFLVRIPTLGRTVREKDDFPEMLQFADLTIKSNAGRRTWPLDIMDQEQKRRGTKRLQLSPWADVSHRGTGLRHFSRVGAVTSTQA